MRTIAMMMLACVASAAAHELAEFRIGDAATPPKAATKDSGGFTFALQAKATSLKWSIAVEVDDGGKTAQVEARTMLGPLGRSDALKLFREACAKYGQPIYQIDDGSGLRATWIDALTRVDFDAYWTLGKEDSVFITLSPRYSKIP